MRRFPSDELERRIDEVLYYQWDPLSVKETPSARWEYRSYTNKLHELLNAGKNAEGLADYLVNIETGQLGQANQERALRVARLVLKHKEAIEEGLA